MTVEELIEMLEEVEDKKMTVELVIAGYSTDHMWIEIINGKILLGTT
ncbi:hypothetical protein [Sporosarcina sp. FSL K6-1508]